MRLLCLLSVQCQDFAPSVQCHDSSCPFLFSTSIQGAASLRVESLRPCLLLPQILPLGSASPNSQLPPSSHSGSRHLTQRSKAQFRKELEGWSTAPPPKKRKPSILAPHPFSPREPSLTANSFRAGRVIYSSNIPTSAGMMEPIKMLGDCFYD